MNRTRGDGAGAGAWGARGAVAVGRPGDRLCGTLVGDHDLRGRGYVLVVEAVIGQLFGGATPWLLGNALTAMAQGGNATLSIRAPGQPGRRISQGTG